MRYEELRESRAMINGVPVLLIKNPAPNILFFRIEGFRKGVARGLIVYDDVFFFDAYLATHAEVEQFLGVPISNKGFDIVDHGNEHFVFAAPDAAMPEIHSNPCMQKILADPRIEIA